MTKDVSLNHEGNNCQYAVYQNIIQLKIIMDLKTKKKIFALYWGQKVLIIPDVGLETVSSLWNLAHPNFFLRLKPLSSITDADAFEVARIIYDKLGDTKNFAIEFNASGITSISPFGLPCYGETIDINWSGEISYQRARTIDILYAYDYLRSKGYALPYMRYTVEDLVKESVYKLIE